MGKSKWITYGVAATALMGLWGALTGLSAENGVPATMVYCIWAFTMVPPAMLMLKKTGWVLDRDKRSIFLGMLIGLLGAGGQLLLFYAVKIGPAYLIFPIISLSPVVTILLSLVFLKERTGWVGFVGICLAVLALPLFEYSSEANDETGYGFLWFALAIIILISWGVQAYFMKVSNNNTSAESIFFYMMLTAVMLIPVSLYLTDFSEPINYGWDGVGIVFFVQIMNAVGALCLVFAFRYGKAIVVSPMTNAGAPLITALFSMAILNVLPDRFKIIGIGLAIAAAILLAIEPEEKTVDKEIVS